jgi:STE24 endopeptidase
MAFLLMAFFTLVCLFPDYPAPLLGFGSPQLAVLLTAALVAGLIAHGAWVTRRATHSLARAPLHRDDALDRFERARVRHQLALFILYTVALFLFGWGWLVTRFWVWPGHGQLPGTELLLLLPFLVVQLVSWAFFYDVERAFHPRTPALDRDASGWLEPHHLLEGEGPARGPASEGGRLGYVVFQARQKLALVFLPVALLIAQEEFHRLFPQAGSRWRGLIDVLGILGLLAVFIGMPWIVRLLLGLRPLPDGPLRQRLLAASRRLKFRCSDVLLWNTRRGMANAMVIGLTPWVRYVIFTDRLLQDFSEDEVEAVFGHEVGHVKHHHMPYYLGFLTASMLVLGMAVPLLLSLAQTFLPADRLAPLATALGLEGRQYVQMVPLVVLLLGYIFVVFGFLSRRCERQADLFGCRAVSCLSPHCWGHCPDVELAAGGRALCATGIRTFIRALEKVALVNGISRDRPGFLQSWQHSTIARRVAFLQDVLLDPSLETRFQRRVRLVKWGLFAALGGALMLILTTQGWQF